MTIQLEQDWKAIIHRCFRCGYCKFTHDYSEFNCPSYKKHRFESYSTGGRLWLIYGLLSGEIQWTPSVANVIYSCSTCGNCMEKTLRERTMNPNMYNPYGEVNSNNKDLKKQFKLNDNAEWVYFIGCTSNYRQKDLRDATLRFLKKAGIDFTLIDEHCCTSPLIRTGQIDATKEIMSYNIQKINEVGASKVITSCAGCFRTLKQDFEKQGVSHNLEIYHTSEVIKNLIDAKEITFNSEFQTKLTYHDPCHLGRHSGLYDAPREVYKQIPGIEFVEMQRNKENSWCCGAGGGVKIGYPDWSLEISKERLEEAKETGAQIISSTCPFCRTNLSDANQKFKMGLEILDLIEIIDNLEFEVQK